MAAFLAVPPHLSGDLLALVSRAAIHEGRRQRRRIALARAEAPLEHVDRVDYVPGMTVGYIPAFEPNVSVGFDGDGAALFHHAAALDEIAEAHGLPTLTSFADDREPPPDFDGHPEELREAIGPWTAWFSTTEGLRCVEGLLAALDESDASARGLHLDVVIDDLEALHDALLAAKKKKARFRLEIG